MLNLLQQFKLRSTYTGAYTNGRIVKSFWDDVAEEIKVHVFTSTGTDLGVQTSGPMVTGNYSGREYRPLTTGYKFCDGTTLNQFRTWNNNDSDYVNAQFIYPYVRHETVANHFTCVVEVVCDIEFDLKLTSVASDTGTSNGVVEVSATSSYSAPRYSRNPNDSYDDAEIANNGTRHVFSGLAAGTYIIYAIDVNGCRSQITAVVPDASSVSNYGVRWRLEYEDKFRYGLTRLDIEEANYDGEIIEIQGAGDPVVQKWLGDSEDDIFKPIIACELEINLISRTHFEFFDLFTQDERKFRVKYYRDTGRIAPEKPEYTETTGLPSLSEWQTTTADALLVDWTTGATPSVDLIGTFISPKSSERLFVHYSFVPGHEYEITVFYTLTRNGLVLLADVTLSILDASMATLFSENDSEAVSGDYSITISFTATEDCKMVAFRARSYRDYTVTVTSTTASRTIPAVPEGPAGFDLKFVGFITPSLYSEQFYTTKNYNVSFVASDQIGLLKTLDFLDDSKNEVKQQVSFLDAISMILRKTDLGLDIIESVNTYAFDFDKTESDSPLNQAYLDPSIYYRVGSEKVFIDGRFETVYNNQPKKCDYVLEQLLVSWGARVYQANGAWRIELIEERSGEVNYRQFTPYGLLKSIGTFEHVVELKDPNGEYNAIVNRSGNLNLLPSYGKIHFDINNDFNNNLLTSGDFETRDIINGQFRGWGMDITNGTGITFGYEKYKEPRKDSLGGLFVDFTNTYSGGKEIVITAETFDLAAIDNVNLKFSFDIFFRPNYEGFYYYVDYSIRIGDHWVNTSSGLPGTSTPDIDGEYLRKYTKDALKWNTIEQVVRTSQVRGRNSPEVTNITLEGPVVIKIRINNHPLYNYESISDLKNAPTDNNVIPLYEGYKVNVLDGDLIRVYELKGGTKSEDSPDYIRPDDYDGSTNKVYWELRESLNAPDIDYLMNSVLIDNVVLSVEREFEELAYEKEFNPDIKQTLTKEITHADFAITSEDVEAPESDQNLQRTIKNMIKDGGGQPTSYWGRSYVADESRTLVDILMRMHAGQVILPSMRLTGSSITNQDITFATTHYSPFLDKKFLNMYLAIHDFDRQVDFEIMELKAGSGGLPPADVFEYTEEFSEEFDA